MLTIIAETLIGFGLRSSRHWHSRMYHSRTLSNLMIVHALSFESTVRFGPTLNHFIQSPPRLSFLVHVADCAPLPSPRAPRYVPPCSHRASTGRARLRV